MRECRGRGQESEAGLVACDVGDVLSVQFFLRGDAIDIIISRMTGKFPLDISSFFCPLLFINLLEVYNLTVNGKISLNGVFKPMFRFASCVKILNLEIGTSKGVFIKEKPGKGRYEASLTDSIVRKYKNVRAIGFQGKCTPLKIPKR